MTHGPTTLKAALSLPISTPGVGTVQGPNLRAARGLGSGEPANLSFLNPTAAGAVTTNSGRVFLGVFATDQTADQRLSLQGAPWDHFTSNPIVAPLKGESTVSRILNGTEQTGIADESGKVITGIDQQLFRIRSLHDHIARNLAHNEMAKVAALRGDLRAAAAALQNDLPTLEKAANVVATNLHDEYSPVVQSVAQAIADRLAALRLQLAAIDIATVGDKRLAKILNGYLWRHTVNNFGQTTRFCYRASPFLASAARSVLEVLARHGRLVRSDMHGHGAMFEFPVAGDCWTNDSTFTRAELSAVLRLLGWKVTASQMQITKTLRTKDGKAVMDRSDMVCETRTRKHPHIRVTLYFSETAPAPK